MVYEHVHNAVTRRSILSVTAVAATMITPNLAVAKGDEVRPLDISDPRHGRPWAINIF